MLTLTQIEAASLETESRTSCKGPIPISNDDQAVEIKAFPFNKEFVVGAAVATMVRF